jgi:hypothetical protein
LRVRKEAKHLARPWARGVKARVAWKSWQIPRGQNGCPRSQGKTFVIMIMIMIIMIMVIMIIMTRNIVPQGHNGQRDPPFSARARCEPEPYDT